MTQETLSVLAVLRRLVMVAGRDSLFDGLVVPAPLSLRIVASVPVFGLLLLRHQAVMILRKRPMWPMNQVLKRKRKRKRKRKSRTMTSTLMLFMI